MPHETEPFLWGVATSSHQIEGYNDKNDWFDWETQGHIEGGVRSGAATDHLHRYQEDIRHAADLGLNSYRFSVEWSRIEPEEGRWDASAVEWYSDLISECERHRLLPMMTLHHFTSPRWFAAQGGFTWKGAPSRFANFTKYMAQQLGSRIPFWCTFNEPMVLAAGTYLAKFMPPAHFSPQHAAEACHQLLKSHALAYTILHSEISGRKGPWKDLPIQVGIAHNMLDFMPDRNWHPLERILTRVFHRYYNRSWLDAVTGGKQNFGVLGLIPNPTPVQEALHRKTIDYIGVNYYTKAYIQWRPRDSSPEGSKDLPFGISFARRKEEVSDVGWAIHPKGFRKILKFASEYGLPLYVTENGIADREDCMRRSYLTSHLREMTSLIREGTDIRGYYHWSLLDNFEWIKGFGPRFGLFRVDYETLERAPRESARLYKKIVQAHRSNGDFTQLQELLDTI